MTGELLVRHAYAPGRVNLIGDHTDYNGGVALPMTIDMGTQVKFTGSEEPELQIVPWTPLAASLVALVEPRPGGVARVTSSLPTGVGLSSSASFCVALALALGAPADPIPLARLCQSAEAGIGSDVGLMDPLAILAGVEGHALLMDFSSLTVSPVPLPEDVEVIAVHSGTARTLESTPYRTRRLECEEAAEVIGAMLGQAKEDDLELIDDPVLMRRARHVISECRRTKDFTATLTSGDLAAAGTLMSESHRSLAQDFEVSTPTIDALVTALDSTRGVYGARMTGGGFGGCVVALCQPGTFEEGRWPNQAWRLAATAGASVSPT